MHYTARYRAVLFTIRQIGKQSRICKSGSRKYINQYLSENCRCINMRKSANLTLYYFIFDTKATENYHVRILFEIENVTV